MGKPNRISLDQKMTSTIHEILFNIVSELQEISLEIQNESGCVIRTDWNWSYFGRFQWKLYSTVSKKDPYQFSESHIPICFQEGFTSIQWVIFHFVSKKDSHQFNKSHIPICFQEGLTSIQWKSYSTLFPRRIHINSKKVIFHFVSKNSYQFNERRIPWVFLLSPPNKKSWKNPTYN